MTERFQLHVALLSAEYPPAPGGVGDYTRRLGQALAARGLRASVLTLRGARLCVLDPAQDERPPVTVAQGIPGWGWASWRGVVAALEAIRPDVLHIQYQTGAYGMHPAVNFLPWRLRGVQRAAGGRPLVAVTAHDLLPPYLFPKAGALRAWVTRRLLTDAGAAVVTNEHDYATAMGWSVRAALIPIGSNIAVDPPPGYARDTWRARLGLGRGELLVAYFGLISRTKGLDVLLDALARLPAHVRLVVVGGEALASQDREYAAGVLRRIADGPLAGRVHVTGHCDEREVSAHLLAADVAALPFSDGASFRRGSLLAALAHGLPTVTTLNAAGTRKAEQQPGMARLTPAQRSAFGLQRLEDGVSALLAPPGDGAALAAAIGRLAVDEGLRTRLAAGGRAVAAQFGWDAIAARHIELYQEALER